MVNNNYYKILAAAFYYDSTTITPFFAKDIEGISRQIYRHNNGFLATGNGQIISKVIENGYFKGLNKALPQGTGASIYNRIIYGDGSKATSADDTFLSGNQVTSFSISSQTTTCKGTDAGVMIEHSEIIQNTGSSSITISEVAYIDYVYCGGKYYNFLLDRTLLDEPITVEAGNTGTITYQLTFNIIPT